jgi:hypothetical protein
MADPDHPEGYVVLFEACFHRRVYERYFALCLPYGAYSAILKQLRDGRAVRLEPTVDRFGTRCGWSASTSPGAVISIYLFFIRAASGG